MVAKVIGELESVSRLTLSRNWFLLWPSPVARRTDPIDAYQTRDEMLNPGLWGRFLFW